MHIAVRHFYTWFSPNYSKWKPSSGSSSTISCSSPPTWRPLTALWSWKTVRGFGTKMGVLRYARCLRSREVFEVNRWRVWVVFFFRRRGQNVQHHRERCDGSHRRSRRRAQVCGVHHSERQTVPHAQRIRSVHTGNSDVHAQDRRRTP